MTDRPHPLGCVALRRLVEPIVTARVLIVAAHPDDETIGAGALLARTIDPHIVIVTDGAPHDRRLWPADVNATTREAYADLRREELYLAMRAAGIPPGRVHLLGVADADAMRQIPVIVNHLVDLLAAIDPQIVLTHAYEGAHVDHDTTALCVHAAMAHSRRGHPHEMAVYHGQGDAVAVHEFLPGSPASLSVHLDDRLSGVKTTMLNNYVSQRKYADYFGTAVEGYRCAPIYDFGASPSPRQPLLYERHTSVTGEQWRAHAAAALQELNVPQVQGVEPEVPSFDPAAPLVSVIVRTVGRDTLLQALDSIDAQTYPRIEIVLVEVSHHGLAAPWHGRDGVVLRSCPSARSDRPTAANAGLDAATGDYIAFLDDDDWFHPEHIASLVTALRASPDARLAYAGVEVVEWPLDGPPTRRWSFEVPFDRIALLCENYIPLNGILVDRRLVDEGGRFDETLPIYEDWDFLIGLSRRTRFEQVPGVSAVYRYPPGSGVTDSQGTAAAQAQVFRKWQSAFSSEEHIAIIRGAIEQTRLNDQRTERLAVLQADLKSRETEIDGLRSRVASQDVELGQRHGEVEQLQILVSAQDRQLAQARDHLGTQESELEQLRILVSAQDRQLAQARDHLGTQESELEQLRILVSAQDRQLAQARDHLGTQESELEQLRILASAQDRQLAQARDHLSTQERELEQLRPHVSAQEREVEQFRQQVIAQETELQELRPRLRKQDEDLETLRTDLASRDRELATLRQRVTVQNEQLASLTNAHAAVESLLARVLRSRSWRLTQPLRTLRAWLASGDPD
jgi:LmbE family N-acetylglucosaminyl deacetylase/predicted  nucleic acid-binding Zn-ribbon protein